MQECFRCKKEEPENTYRFAIVARQTTSSTQHYVVAKKTTTTVYEKLVSFERCSICSSCIKKERVKYVLKWTGFIAFFLLCALSVGGLRTGSFGLWIPIVLGIGTLIGFIGVLISSLFRKDAFYAADIRSNIASKGSAVKYRFVPINTSLYCPKGKTVPELKIFKEKGGLRTSVADRLFEQYILPGNGEEQIDSLIVSNMTNKEDA